jgi:hypothetical protein
MREFEEDDHVRVDFHAVVVVLDVDAEHLGDLVYE